MRCAECEHIEPVLHDDTAFWIYPPTRQASGDLQAALSAAGFSVRALGNSALMTRAERHRVEALVGVLSETLKGPELGFAKILTTAGGEPTPEELGRIVPVEVFVNRHKGDWIIESIQNERFESWFQPIVHAADPKPDAPFAQEALFRMYDGSGAMVPPGIVFGLAGASDLLFTLDLIARRSAVECAARAKIASKLFINFNPSSIYDPAYCLRTTAAAIRDLGMRPEDVVFELTETHRARDEQHLKGILDFYRSAGFGVALDDIGSGWSGLNMLHEYKPDYVKIDMDLVRDVDTDHFKQTIVTHLVSIARTLGIRTIGEGVETEGEATWMRTAGVNYLQGFYFARPAALPAAVSTEEVLAIQKASERFNTRVSEVTPGAV